MQTLALGRQDGLDLCCRREVESGREGRRLCERLVVGARLCTVAASMRNREREVVCQAGKREKGTERGGGGVNAMEVVERRGVSWCAPFTACAELTCRAAPPAVVVVNLQGPSSRFLN